MAHDVVTRVGAMSDRLAANADVAEADGRLPDETVGLLRRAGVVRMLQPVDFGGDEAHPCDFLEAVMEIGRHCGAAGWVAGVVGVHPWELALMDPHLQAEVWAGDPDTWIASPYAPKGIARRVDGGYLLSGRWPFSSGTDHCDWIFLGAMAAGRDGVVGHPPVGLHVVLPRADYVIDHDSWHASGLGGTGSKDVTVDDVFVPDYRTLKAAELLDQTIARRSPRWESPVYRMPWSSIFPAAITAGVIGACQGALDAHLDHQRRRDGNMTGRAVDDAVSMHAIGLAASDLAASRSQLLANTSQAFDMVTRGEMVDLRMRSEFRRDQVRCSWRAVEAIDRIVPLSGGNAMRATNPIQRFWRDAHVGLHHATNATSGVFQFYAMQALGLDSDSPIRLTI